jgi:hypothetical protein
LIFSSSWVLSKAFQFSLLPLVLVVMLSLPFLYSYTFLHLVFKGYPEFAPVIIYLHSHFLCSHKTPLVSFVQKIYSYSGILDFINFSWMVSTFRSSLCSSFRSYISLFNFSTLHRNFTSTAFSLFTYLLKHVHISSPYIKTGSYMFTMRNFLL